MIEIIIIYLVGAILSFLVLCKISVKENGHIDNDEIFMFCVFSAFPFLTLPATVFYWLLSSIAHKFFKVK